MKKVAAAIAGVVAVAALAGVVGSRYTGEEETTTGAVLGARYSAAAPVSVGVADDAGKYAEDKGASFFDELESLGMTENRVTVTWDPDSPTTIRDKAFLDRSLPEAAKRGIRVVLAVYPAKSRAVADSADATAQFVAFVDQLARTYPQVKEFIIGNEPNQPRFWQPQFSGDGSGAAAAAYLPLLAGSYDALKAIDPAISVVGVGLSPRGNDNPSATSNVSTSPVAFIRDLGRAYKASGRTQPIMDKLAFHPYPNAATDPLAKGYQWPNASIANLDRIKQAVWDAFAGTAQPTFAEGGSEQGLTVKLAEVGWQVGVVPSAAGAYHGAENVPVTNEETQAAIYADVVRKLVCDRAVDSILFFGLRDEADLDRFQAGLMRADGTKRPSYDAVKSAIEQTGGRCQGQPVSWRHTTSVIGAKADFTDLGTRKPATQRYWSFRATAEEDAKYQASIFRLAGPKLSSANQSAITRSLAVSGTPAAVLATSATVNAYWNVLVKFPGKTLAPGHYVAAVRMTSTMNPQRTSTFVSKPFQVGSLEKKAAKKPTKKKPAKKKPAAKKKR